MYPLQFGLLHHEAEDTIGNRGHLLPVVALYTHLQRVSCRLIVQLFETRISVREIILIATAVLFEDLSGSMAGLRVHNELCVVGSRCLRRISCMETRGRLTNEGRHTRHTPIGTQDGR